MFLMQKFFSFFKAIFDKVRIENERRFEAEGEPEDIVRLVFCFLSTAFNVNNGCSCAQRGYQNATPLCTTRAIE